MPVLKIYVLLAASLVVLAAADANALSCEHQPFNPDLWIGPVFKAETVDDRNEYTIVRIVECIQKPCKVGNATVHKEYWGFGKPRTEKGEMLVWTVLAGQKAN